MNGEATHEWRIEQLEKRMDIYERAMNRMMLALVGNLAGIVVLLVIKILEHSK